MNILLNLKNKFLSALLIVCLFAQPLLVFADDEITSYVSESNNPILNSKPVGLQNEVPNGDYVYRYKIDLPSGINNMTPDIDLAYSSDRYNKSSIYGMGWSDSIPYIEAINKTGYKDIYNYENLTSSLDGEIIKLDSGNYVPKVSSSEGYRSYEKNGDTWIVKDIDGNVFTFGQDINSRSTNPDDINETSKWMLSELKDPNGNKIKYTYFEDSGEIYPDKIFYGITSESPLTYSYSVEFSRSSRGDTVYSYSKSYRISTNYKIDKIEVKYLGNVIKTHDISYLEHGIANKIFIESIQESGSSFFGIAKTKPPVEFEYNLDPISWELEDEINLISGTTPNAGSNPSGLSSHKFFRIFMDVNGDGVDDIYDQQQDTAGVYIRTGNGFVRDNSWTYPNGQSSFGFLNGSANAGNYRHGGYPADINGDGLVDWVKWIIGDVSHNPHPTGGFHANVFVNTGSGWEKDPTLSVPFKPDTYKPNRAGFRDINGDGIIDAVDIYEGIYLNQVSVDGHTEQWLHEGNFSWRIPYRDRYNPSFIYSTYIDMNGDGLQDYFIQDDYTNEVYINKGGGFVLDENITYPETWGDRYMFPNGRVGHHSGDYSLGGFPLDINGDGMTDWISWVEGDIQHNPNIDESLHSWVYVNNGSGWVHDPNISIPYIPVLQGRGGRSSTHVDINGDGLPDFIYADASDPREIKTNRGGDLRLVSVKSESGYEIDLEYSAIAFSGDNNRPVVNKSVVTKVTSKNGLGDNYVKKFKYNGASFYFDGTYNKKFAGFQSIEEINESTGRKTITYYHQGNDDDLESAEIGDSYYKIGHPYRTVLLDEDENKYEEIIKNWSVLELLDGRKVTLLTEEIDKVYDIKDNSFKEKGSVYEHDTLYGQIKKTKLLGEVSFDENDGDIYDIDNQDNKIIETGYASGPDIYKSSGIILKNDGDEILAQERIYYDNLPFGQISLGNQTKVSKWDNSSDSWIDDVAEFNAYGLPVKNIDSLGGEMTYSYDTDYLYPKTIVNDLGHVVQNEYDFNAGQVYKITDENNSVVQTIFDAFGRQTQVQKTAPSGSLKVLETYVYDDDTMPRSLVKATHSTIDPKITYAYTDGFGRTNQIKDLTPNSNYTTKNYRYDREGKLIYETLPYVTNTFSFSGEAPSSIKKIRYAYDVLDRLYRQTTPMGTELIENGAWEKELLNKRGYTKKTIYDSHGNIQVIENQLNTLGATSSVAEIIDHDSLPYAFEYRQKLSISGHEDAGSNYQVLVKVGKDSQVFGADVNLDGHSLHFPETRNHGGDLQFYAEDEVTELPFWVEKVEADVAYVWVKVLDSLEVSKDIYIYYGHRNPTNFSDGEATFIFFDEFEGSTLDTSKWSTDSASANVSSGFVEVINDDPDSNSNILKTKKSFGSGKATSFVAYVPGVNTLGINIGYDGSYFFSQSEETNGPIIHGVRTNGNGGTGGEQEINPDYRGSYHKFEIARPNTGKTLNYLDDEYKRSSGKYYSDSEKFRAYQRREEWRSGNIKIDWVSVRKYKENGPKVIAVSSEEDIAGVHERYRLLASEEGELIDAEDVEEEMQEFEEDIKVTEISEDSPVASSPEIDDETDHETEQNSKAESAEDENTNEEDTLPEQGHDESDEIQSFETEQVNIDDTEVDIQDTDNAGSTQQAPLLEEEELDQKTDEGIDNKEDENEAAGLDVQDDDISEEVDTEGDPTDNTAIIQTSSDQIVQESVVSDTKSEEVLTTGENVEAGELPIETKEDFLDQEVLDTEEVDEEKETYEDNQDEGETASSTEPFAKEGGYVVENLTKELKPSSSIKLQKPAKSYNYKEKIWLLDGKISKKEARHLNLKNRILKKRQTLANINSSIDKKKERIQNLKDKIEKKKGNNKEIKEFKQKLKDNKAKLKKLQERRSGVKEKISELKEDRGTVKEKIKSIKESTISEKISKFFLSIKGSFMAMFKVKEVFADTWADESYQSRIQINVEGQQGAGNDYQVLLKVGKNNSSVDADFHLNNSSEFFPSSKDDGGDLVFYNSDSSERLDFWVEKVEDEVAYIWVKVTDDLSVNGAIYLYFGNDGPVNYSDGESTFIFFEDMQTSPATSELAYNYFSVGQQFTEVSNYALHIKQEVSNFDMHPYGSSLKYGVSHENSSSNRFMLKADTDWHASYVKGRVHNGSAWEAEKVSMPDVSLHDLVIKKDGSNYNVYKDSQFFAGSDSASTSGIDRFRISGIDISNSHGETNGFAYDAANQSLEFSATRDDTNKNISIKMYEIFLRKFKENEPAFLSAGLIENNDINGESGGEQGGSSAIFDELEGHTYTYYEYDLQDNLVKVTDPDGNEREFVYDSLGRQLSSELPHVPGELAATYSYEYDSVGNKTKETRPDGSVINYTYDQLHRLLTVDNPANPGIETTYTYDTAANGIGKLATVTGSDYSRSYSYDQAGNLSSETLTVGGQTYITSYSYNDYGLLNSTTYPDGTVVANTYNVDGSIDSVEKDSVNVVSFGYNHIGQVTDKDYANGVEEDYVYDDETLFRLESKSVTSATSTLEDIDYAYDEIGNVTAITNTGSEIPYTKLYSYDSLDRLQTATTTINGTTTDEVYTYSNAGNILSHNGNMYQYGNVTFPHAATGFDGNVYAYDNNGNLSNKNDITYTYDWNNRLSSVDDTSGNVTSYGYSENRQRLSKTVGTSTKYYVGETTEIENGNSTNYVFAGNSRVATIDNVGDITYSHSDHLGSGSLETDNTGAVTSQITYKPYGSEEYTSGSRSNDHTYTDQEKDSETGLMYYNARYYDPELKRFTSVDAWGGEIENPQTLNKYAYVNNNPLKYTDPSGNYWESAIDALFLGLSVQEYNNNPTFLNGAFVALDGAGLALPIPAVAGYVKNSAKATQMYKYFKSVSRQSGTSVGSIAGTYAQKALSGFKQGGLKWSTGGSRGAGDSLGSLVGHFHKHKNEFAHLGIKTVDDYYQGANKLINSVDNKNVFKIPGEKVNTTNYVNKSTGEYVSVNNKTNDIATYMIPTSQKTKNHVRREIKKITN